MARIFKVHTDTLGRLIACLEKAMYGVSKSAFVKELPSELRSASEGDIVFISEKEVSRNALFGPLYIVGNAEGIVPLKKYGAWYEVDTKKSDQNRLAYWVDFEGRNHCLLFDSQLNDRISIVWPSDWAKLNISLPSWGLVSGDDASKLVEYAVRNEQESKEFFRKHKFW